MKNYYIEVELGEGIPTYNFVVKAIDNKHARRYGWAEIDASYPDVDMKVAQLSCREITAEKLLTILTIN